MINLALIVLIILLSAVLKVSFWYLLFAGIIFMLLRYIGIKAVTNAVIILLFIVLAPIITKSFMPGAHAGLTPTRMRADQIVTELLPSEFDVNVNAIFNEERDVDRSKFTLWYKTALSQGRVEEAKDSLLAFEKKWTLKKEKEEAKYAEPTVLPERVYSWGRHVIEIEEGETPFYIVIKFNEGIGGRFSVTLKSEDDYSLIFQDGSVYNVNSNIKLPSLFAYKFKIKTANKRETIYLDITKKN